MGLATGIERLEHLILELESRILERLPASG